MVILGAKLRPGASPSPAVIRRVNAALGLTTCYPDLVFMPSGGVIGGRQRSEAEVMREMLLAAGVSEDRIVIESRSRNTFENALHCARLLHEELSPGTVIICSDSYHLFRAKWLFRILGIRAAGHCPVAIGHRPLLRFLLFARELLATARDVPQMFVKSCSARGGSVQKADD